VSLPCFDTTGKDRKLMKNERYFVDFLYICTKIVNADNLTLNGADANIICLYRDGTVSYDVKDSYYSEKAFAGHSG
jgi:hypothetical protein